MSVTAIRNGRAGHGTRQSLLASALTWLWPEPLEHNRRPVGAIWLNSLVGWMWPRPLQREFDGAGVRRAGLPRLMGWAWPNKLDIALTRDQDNPQLIFESMNSTGKELSQADLIRNFILMGLDPELQTKLYEQFWRH